MSLVTPEKIRTLQRKLYRKAKAARHKVAGRGTKRFSCLWGTWTPASQAPVIECTVVCLAMKPVGEPDAVAPHVRFDERGWETGRWPLAPSYRAHPRLYQMRSRPCG